MSGGNDNVMPRTRPTYTPYQEQMLKSYGYLPKKCAKKRRDRETGELVPCAKWAVSGGDFCNTHGGNKPTERRKAAAKIRDHVLAKAMVTFGLPVDVSPQVAMQQELARTNGHVLWLADKIQSMENGELIWGQIEESHRSGSADESNWDEEKVGAVMSLWVQLYQRERTHLVRLTDLMVKNGLSAVSLRLKERQLDLMEAGLLSVARSLGHADDDPAVRSAIALALRQMAESAREPLEIEPATAPKRRN